MKQYSYSPFISKFYKDYLISSVTGLLISDTRYCFANDPIWDSIINFRPKYYNADAVDLKRRPVLDDCLLVNVLE